MNDKRFILWNMTDGEPGKNEAGEIVSSGLMGLLDESNVYLTAYAQYHDKRHTDLAVNESASATFRLSGQRGDYLVIRVR